MKSGWAILGRFRILVCASLAILAFAGNSVLCRLALSEQSIDAGSFTVIRLCSGAIILFFILLAKRGKNSTKQLDTGSWFGAVTLFLYAATFSYAYVSLETGVGALILFGTVQITMILVSLATGNRHHVLEWVGMAIAFSGFVYLVLPDLSGPSLLGFILMATSGMSWGLYTLIGRRSANPLTDTAYNFLRALPFCLVLVLFVFLADGVQLSERGVLLAVLSGAIASGLGYTLWYMALSGLSTTLAAVLQLLVPVIAAIGGVLFAEELVTSRLLLAALLVLGGISIVVWGRHCFPQDKHA